MSRHYTANKLWFPTFFIIMVQQRIVQKKNTFTTNAFVIVGMAVVYCCLPLPKMRSSFAFLSHTSWSLRLKYCTLCHGTKFSLVTSFSKLIIAISMIPSKRSRYPIMNSSTLYVSLSHCVVCKKKDERQLLCDHMRVCTKMWCACTCDCASTCDTVWTCACHEALTLILL